MAFENKRPDVAVFIDFENVYVSVRDKLDANPNFETIMDRCDELGRVVIARAYADWYRYPRVTSALYANGIEPMYVPTYYYDKDMGRTGRAIKNSVDMNLCIDAMRTLFTNTNISKFVLITGDRDFIPLVNSIRQQGKEVIIIGIGGAASTHLAQSADEFIFYEQLVGISTAPPASTRKRAQAADQGRAAAVVPPPEEAKSAIPTPPEEVDVYDVLVDAVHLVRERGYVSTLGSLKLVMKELMGGDFKESRYRDVNGRPFAKFKDFVLDAERRNKVIIFTSGTVNEVFLPGEDPYKLSQFAADLKEEPEDSSLTIADSTNGRVEETHIKDSEIAVPPSSTGRRRRRRSRSQRQAANREEQEEMTQESPMTSPEAEPELFESAAFEQFEAPTEPEVAGTEDTHIELAEAQETAPPVEAVSSVEPAPAEQMTEPIDVAGIPTEQEAPLSVEAETTAETVPADHAEPVEVPGEAGEVLPPADEAETAYVPEQTPAEGETEPAEPAPAADTPSLINVAEALALTTTAEQPAEEPLAAEPIADTEIPPAAESAEETAAPAPAQAQPADEEPDDAELAGEEPVTFEDEEWQVFSKMMAGFTKPVSFAHIFDSLRELRKEQQLTRTNEQLRTMVKQAINNGMIERRGRGKRVYYELKRNGNEQSATDGEQ